MITTPPATNALVPVCGLLFGQAAGTQPSAGQALFRSGAGAADPLGGTAIPSGSVAALRRRAGGGDPLPDELGSAGSEALGRDLSGVRLHTGPEAAGLARSVQAHAFTYGHDIYFAEGAYRPKDSAGQQLIAHELGHIGQDAAGTGQIGRADDPAEAAADRAGNGVLAALRRRAALPARVDTGPVAPVGLTLRRANKKKKQRLRHASTAATSAVDRATEANGDDEEVRYSVAGAGGAYSAAAASVPGKLYKIYGSKQRPHKGLDTSAQVSDSEDESEFSSEHGRARLRLPKEAGNVSVADLVLNRSKWMGEPVDHGVENLEAAEANLLEHAKEIRNQIAQQMARGRTTIICAILQRTRDATYWKFVFTNKKGAPGPAIMSRAKDLKYEVISAAQGHAESEMIVYLKSREATYTLVSMACDKDHCPECDLAMSEFFGDSYLLKSRSKVGDRVFEQWKMSKGLQDALGWDTGATPFRDENGVRKPVKTASKQAPSQKKNQSAAGSKRKRDQEDEEE